MPRTARADLGGYCYHVLNRGNGRAEVFHKDADYAAFARLLRAACARFETRLLAYCLMPNHFHLVLWPKQDGELGEWMQWLLTTHVRRYHLHYHSSGHVWQGRYKAFPIQEDDHLLTVMRYVERNALRACLVRRAEDWRWSSLRCLENAPALAFLSPSPVPRTGTWVEDVNRPATPAELERVRQAVERGSPFGEASWVERTAKVLGLESTLRSPGRPRQNEPEPEADLSLFAEKQS